MTRTLLTGAMLLALQAPVQAQEGGSAGAPDMPSACTIKDASQYITIVVCDPPQEDATYAETGRAICGDQQACGVWFWTSEEEAPQTAPANHDALTQQQIVSATGVWSAVDEVFVRIEQNE